MVILCLEAQQKGMVINMATDRTRYTVSVSNEMFQEIENFRFEHRFQTRSEATAELIRLGIEALKKQERAKKISPKRRRAANKL